MADANSDLPPEPESSSPTAAPDETEAGPATFDGAINSLEATGASVGTRQLVELIVRHGEEEGALLATYEHLAVDAADESVRYLIDLILEDEHRHHRLLAELGNAMAWGSSATPPMSIVPRLPGAIDGALLKQTKLLRRGEQADRRALKRIRRHLRPYAHSTLWVLVVDLMLLDTKKHTTILQFLEQRRSR